MHRARWALGGSLLAGLTALVGCSGAGETTGSEQDRLIIGNGLGLADLTGLAGPFTSVGLATCNLADVSAFGTWLPNQVIAGAPINIVFDQAGTNMATAASLASTFQANGIAVSSVNGGLCGALPTTMLLNGTNYSFWGANNLGVWSPWTASAVAALPFAGTLAPVPFGAAIAPLPYMGLTVPIAAAAFGAAVPFAPIAPIAPIAPAVAAAAIAPLAVAPAAIAPLGVAAAPLAVGMAAPIAPMYGGLGLGYGGLGLGYGLGYGALGLGGLGYAGVGYGGLGYGGLGYGGFMY